MGFVGAVVRVGSFAPRPACGGPEGFFTLHTPPFSSPGCPESPAERLRYEPPGISSTVSVTCGLPCGCHVDWLGKCAFGCGNNAFGAYARECVSKSHSPAQYEYSQVVLSRLASDLCLLLPCSSVHVSLSSSLDEAFAF